MSDLYGVAASRLVQDVEPRCEGCDRMLARVVTRPWVIDCPRCRHRNEADRAAPAGARFAAAST